jgi:ribosome-binding factor A
MNRINSQILSTINELILTKTKDPRLVGLTVTKAIVSGDLSNVRLFYSLLGGEEQLAQAEKALQKAKGFIRSHLAATLNQKYTPRLIFERDLNPEYAQRVNRLLGGLSPQASESEDVLESNESEAEA